MSTQMQVSFWQAALYWLKLGFVSFGGPAGQISLMHQELVEKRHWISEQRFLHALNYCMVLPGPEAQQLATYIGWLMHGPWGGILAGALFVLPSLIILILISWFYLVFGQVSWVAGLFYGIKPAVTAIVFFAAYRIGSRTITNKLLKAMAGSAFIASVFLEVDFPFIVLIAALLGYLGGQYYPNQFQSLGGHNTSKVSYGNAVIDNDTPTPDHARFKWRTFWQYLAIGLGLWSLSILCLALLFGWESTYSQLAWFLTKAALLTFGGAYAVLPYVYQGAVEHYHWLSSAQMIDGLALGETTPGPLIMIVAFVGFIAGWTHILTGAESQFLSGALGAAIATFFTFLPSFLFILIGGPFVESTHGDLKFTAPLTGISAAVVGVILKLACFFAVHILWPKGITGTFDWAALILSVLAMYVLWKYKMDIVHVILLCALLGLVKSIAF